MLPLETLRHYLQSFNGAEEDFPFGPETLVVKVAGKMFALILLSAAPLRMNLKCDPDKAVGQRAFYPAVLPGYHMNKRHWNTVILDGSIPEKEILSMIDESYGLVVKNLSRAARHTIGRSQPKETP